MTIVLMDIFNQRKPTVPFFLLVRYIGKNLKFGRIIIGGIDEKIKCWCTYYGAIFIYIV